MQKSPVPATTLLQYTFKANWGCHIAAIVLIPYITNAEMNEGDRCGIHGVRNFKYSIGSKQEQHILLHYL